MGVPFLDEGPMRVEEYYAFTETRPDEEKWELIDGEPILSDRPTHSHQKIIADLIGLLGSQDRQSPRDWQVLPGLCVRSSDTRIAFPDVQIPPDKFIDGWDCDDMIAPSKCCRRLKRPHPRRVDEGHRKAPFPPPPSNGGNRSRFSRIGNPSSLPLPSASAHV